MSDNDKETEQLPVVTPEPRLEEIVRETPKKPLPDGFAYWDDVWGHWGQKPDEYVVVNCDYNTQTYGLAKHVAGRVEVHLPFDQIAPPQSAAPRPPEYADRFYVGDLVIATLKK